MPFLNKDIFAVEEFLMTTMDINSSDKGSRTALYLAASYNSPVTENILSVTDVNSNKPEVVRGGADKSLARPRRKEATATKLNTLLSPLL